ncbi:hypothetical protein F4778DRAFT_726311 [Xylariomycetidae sp. FL2044]|nr:hypothetical protein F4778DRAFT_726311 [Xylariomycetidae sp. FL2044]
MAPSRILADVDHFEPVGPSKEPIDYVDLMTVDLGRYDEGPEARQELAAIVKQAMTTKGFFVLINHGVTEAEIARHVDIGHTIMKRTSAEEKLRLKSPIVEKGSYPGFKARGQWSVGNHKDRIDQFNIYRDFSQHEQPTTLEPYRDEVQGLADFYFAVPNDEVVINTLLDRSPVLREAGVAMAHRPEDAPTSKEWCNGRIILTGKSKWAHSQEGATTVTEKVGKVTTSWFK